MSNDNAIVQATPEGTMNQIINSLTFAIAGLNPIAESVNDDQQKQLTAEQADGLRLQLENIKLATQTGFEQYAAQKAG
jgi:hypothetical protein